MTDTWGSRSARVRYKKLEVELEMLIAARETQPSSITQSQSAIPMIGSRMGWENIITITVVYAE